MNTPAPAPRPVEWTTVPASPRGPAAHVARLGTLRAELVATRDDDVWHLSITQHGERLFSRRVPASHGDPRARAADHLRELARGDYSVDRIEGARAALGRCSLHPAYEVDYCPVCGTTTPIGDRA